MNSEAYSTEEFEAKYTYSGNDLGATWSPDATAFRVWAPTARAVKVRLYRGGTAGVDDLLEQVDMTADVCGTWVARKSGDLNGVYYTYLVDLGSAVNEACDPYARTTGVNGQRAMVIDLASTNPKNWHKDADPHAGQDFTDAVIYELHVRDLSCDESAGIRDKGKFLGLIQRGTTNGSGIPTGLDHMKALGITHLHLLPSYDYGSVDEAHPEANQFNWGYDPLNFNVPEGSYATDPFHGEVRVREMKQMVKGLHDNGISVVMDVVYNHVYDGGSFCFNRIVPQYFSRVDGSGTYSNGSGCGNDTASERSMVRKYIVDSVKYWADEYHIDGFRFDLVGLLDVQTINAIMEEVRKTHPNVVFYGEGWDMSTRVTKPNIPMAIQANSPMTPGFAYFNDTLRDLLRGTVFDDRAPGFVSGAAGYEDTLRQCFLGLPHWCKSPAQTVNYGSCHDNMALFDRIVVSTPNATRAEQIRMNNLSAAICMTCQGIPFMQAGEEMLRSKPRADGSFEHNSYCSPDSVNSLKWDCLNGQEYRDVLAYYQGLIAFRKAHKALRMTTAEEVSANIRCIPGSTPGLVEFLISGSDIAGEPSEALYVAFNAGREARQLQLPEGKWEVCVNERQAGTKALATVEGSVTVAPISALVLTKERPDTDGKKVKLVGAMLGGVAAAAVTIGGTVAAIKRKHK